ncbi:hypothetical protein FRC02_007459 [Tulasnella sp. 418]|nr:hypothetical protein FRC02_007459 [Tulasnella sp. 418]
MRVLNQSPYALHRATIKDFVQEALEQGVVPPGVYWIRSALSRMAVDMQGFGTDPGTPVINYEVNQAENQKWIIQAAANGYIIRNLATDTYLSLADGVELAPFAPVTGNPQPAEWNIFREGPYFTFRLASNENFAMDLKAAGFNNNNPIIFYNYHKGVTQQWILAPV